MIFPAEPKFVGSAVIPDNDDRDDDKVYFFFTERVMNAEGVNKAVYTRVGRICAVRKKRFLAVIQIKPRNCTHILYLPSSVRMTKEDRECW